jgi:hypothetical protein
MHTSLVDWCTCWTCMTKCCSDKTLGMFAADVGGRRGIESGRLGLAVAEVGKGGKERISGDIPGMRSATTFWILLTFLEIRYSVSEILSVKKSSTYINAKPIWRWCICKNV